MHEREGQRLGHESQRRIASGQQLIRRHLEQRGEDLTQFDEPVEPTVVASVDTTWGEHVVTADRGEQIGGEVELLGCGLAAGDVEVEAA